MIIQFISFFLQTGNESAWRPRVTFAEAVVAKDFLRVDLLRAWNGPLQLSLSIRMVQLPYRAGNVTHRDESRESDG